MKKLVLSFEKGKWFKPIRSHDLESMRFFHNDTTQTASSKNLNPI